MEAILYPILLTLVIVAVAICNAMVCRAALKRQDDALLKSFADRAMAACDLSLEARRIENEKPPPAEPDAGRFSLQTRHHQNNSDVIIPTGIDPIN